MVASWPWVEDSHSIPYKDEEGSCGSRDLLPPNASSNVRRQDTPLTDVVALRCRSCLRRNVRNTATKWKFPSSKFKTTPPSSSFPHPSCGTLDTCSRLLLCRAVRSEIISPTRLFMLQLSQESAFC